MPPIDTTIHSSRTDEDCDLPWRQSDDQQFGTPIKLPRTDEDFDFLGDSLVLSNLIFLLSIVLSIQHRMSTLTLMKLIVLKAINLFTFPLSITMVGLLSNCIYYMHRIRELIDSFMKGNTMCISNKLSHIHTLF
ncbi:hypothetical protein P9112_005115 [Eukaryota sp. TZLM1-RC]